MFGCVTVANESCGCAQCACSCCCAVWHVLRAVIDCTPAEQVPLQVRSCPLNCDDVSRSAEMSMQGQPAEIKNKSPRIPLAPPPPPAMCACLRCPDGPTARCRFWKPFAPHLGQIYTDLARGIPCDVPTNDTSPCAHLDQDIGLAPDACLCKHHSSAVP